MTSKAKVTPDSKFPVLLLGSGARLCVTLARSLSGLGVPVFVAPVSGDPPVYSRAIARWIELPDFRTSGDAFCQALLDLIGAHRIDMIIPTGDGAMTALAQHYSVLAARVHLACPSPEVMERVLDKTLTLKAAQNCGLPCPATLYLDKPEGELAQLQGLRFPVIGKPAIRKGASEFKVRHFASLTSLQASIEEQPEHWRGALIQEYIPGVGRGVGVLMHQGEALAVFQHRRIRELPYSGGVSVVAEAEAVDPKLAELAVALLREIGWEGVAMVEYRCDLETGRFALMEINGRYWGSLFLPFLAGYDIPRYEWLLAHGRQPQVPASYRVGMQARWLAGDIERLHGIVTGEHRCELASPSIARELLEFTRSVIGVDRDALWLWSDPIPGLQELWRTLIELAKRDIRRFAAIVLPAAIKQKLRIYRDLPAAVRGTYLRQEVRRLLTLQRPQFLAKSSPVQQLLFICHGNVIRSAMAECSLKCKLQGTQAEGVHILSAGLWEGLARVAPRPSPEEVQAVAQGLGLSLEGHRSRPVTQELIDTSDLVFVMDYQNEAMLLSQYPSARGKTHFLGRYRAAEGENSFSIEDPWGNTEEELHRCLVGVEQAVSSLARDMVRQCHH